MMQLLGCFSMLAFVAFFFVLALVSTVVQSILRMFGLWPRRGNPFFHHDFTQPRQDSKEEQTIYYSQDSQPKSQDKVFADDEGEYVDFEEVD